MRSAIHLVGLTLAFAAAASGASGATWEIDGAHTTVGFGIRHLTISTVRGEFEKVSGTVEAVGDPTTAKVQATIDTPSINTRNAKRDEHLKSADFFDVEKFPTITFESKKVEASGAGHWKVTGDLTLHGVTREVVLDVEGPTATVKDPMGKTRAGAHATAQIYRKDFGLTWNKSLDGGGLVLGETVEVSIDVEGVQQTP